MRPKDIKLANEIQSACNPVAVAGAMHKMLLEWREFAPNGWEDLNNYPPYLAILGKLCDMARVEHDSIRCYMSLPLTVPLNTNDLASTGD